MLESKKREDFEIKKSFIVHLFVLLATIPSFLIELLFHGMHQNGLLKVSWYRDIPGAFPV